MPPSRFLRGVRPFSAKLFTSATAVLPKSGTGILPVITGHHRQDADATSSNPRWIKRDSVKTRIENALSRRTGAKWRWPLVPEPARWRVWLGSNWGRRRLRAWAGQSSESHGSKRMPEDGVRAADTAQTQSSERCHERGACQRAPLYPLLSSSIRGLFFFLFNRVTPAS